MFMADVAGFTEEDSILTHIHGQVADALDGTGDEDEMQQVFRAAIRIFETGTEGGDHLLVQAVEFLVASFETLSELRVRVGISEKCISQKFVC